MSLTPVALVDQLGEFEQSVSLDGPRGAERSKSLEWLRSNGLPTSRDEAWKYTPLKDVMARQVDRLAVDADGLQQPPELAAAAVIPDELRVVMVDGVHREDLSSDLSGTVVDVTSLDSVTSDSSDNDPSG